MGRAVGEDICMVVVELERDENGYRNLMAARFQLAVLQLQVVSF